MTKDGSNARKKAARELSAADQITYTEALRRVDQRAARTSPAGEQSVAAAGVGRVTTRVTPPVATLTTDVVLIGHTGAVSWVAFGPDGRTLASSSTDRTVRLWDPATGQPAATLFGHTEFVRSAAFSPDGQMLATASMDGTVRLWTLGEST